MLFRTYGFAPARSLTMFFGSLVHQSIEDLHQRLIGLKGRVA
jgi:DNA helicase-2/ATP-dependent DNA helicase PcrA